MALPFLLLRIGAPAVIVSADIVEAANATDALDATVVFAVDVIEAADAVDANDATADLAGILDEPAAALDDLDAAADANIVSAEIYEPIHPGWTADSITVTADSTYWTADGGPLLGATDVADAEVISVPVEVEGGGGILRPPLRPIIGVGYGVLPQLEGEDHGAVGGVGEARGTLPRLTGEAIGSVGAAGRAAGQLVVLRAVAGGSVNQAGKAVAILKGLSVAGAGVAVVRGSGLGVILKPTATAIGRHDDDEAAVLMTFLLAA